MTAALLPAPNDGSPLLPRGPLGAAGVEMPAPRPYLVPVPDCEPPFDDETRRCPHHGCTDCGDAPEPRFEVRHGAWHAGRSTLRDQLPGPSAPGRAAAVATAPAGPAQALRVPVLPSQALPGRALPGQALATATGPTVTGTVRVAPRPSVSPAEHHARMLARALVEVLAGHRPLSQLRTFCTPAVFAALERRGRHPTPALPHVLSVRVCEPADGVAEVAAVFRRGDRVRMVAFRLERLVDPTCPVGVRWTITAVQAG